MDALTQVLSQRPGDHEAFDYHRDYIAKVPDGNILTMMEAQAETIDAFIRGIPADQFQVIHEPYGWSIQTVLEHCCDAERVFGYRILRFAAGDQTDLPGWDQDIYATENYGPNTTLDELADKYAALRKGNLCILKRLTPDAFGRMGTADGRKVSVRTLAWLMAGHWNHHEEILRKRLGM